MRHLFLLLAFVGLCANAAAQDPTADATPVGLDEWIGRGEIPWTIPPVTAANVIKPTTVEFTSPVVIQVLSESGVNVLRVSKTQFQVRTSTVNLTVIHSTKSRHLEAAPVSENARTVSNIIPALTGHFDALKRLSVKDQSAVMQAVLADWSAFYTLAGPNVPQAMNHFGKIRTALQARAESEGITPALLLDCQAYQKELQDAVVK